MFYILFFTLNLKFPCVFYTYGTSQFGPATFKVLSRHIWLVAAILDRAVLGKVLEIYMFGSIPGDFYQVSSENATLSTGGAFEPF